LKFIALILLSRAPVLLARSRLFKSLLEWTLNAPTVLFCTFWLISNRVIYEWMSSNISSISYEHILVFLMVDWRESFLLNYHGVFQACHFPLLIYWLKKKWNLFKNETSSVYFTILIRSIFWISIGYCCCFTLFMLIK
jgi:hypothetical protein